jgi:hypothetical protein
MPSDDELDQLFAPVGSRLKDEDMGEVWPVPGLIHPGLTCVMGQPERGKTTLLITLCAALLRGGEWLGEPTQFPADKRIIFLCEDRTSGGRVLKSFKDTVLEDQVIVRRLHRWEAGTSLDEVVDRTSAGLVVIDSVYPAVSDVNDQARADAFLSPVQALQVPAVVVHHEAKDSSSGTPAGVQRFRAAYRQTIRIRKCSPEGCDGLALDLDVSGNDVPGRTRYSVLVNRQSLATEIQSAGSADAPTGRESRRRAKRMNPEQKATELGRMAHEAGQAAGLPHTTYATALLGGSRGKEQKDKQLVVASALNLKSVTHHTVGNLIRDNLSAFEAGFAAVNGDARQQA